MAVQPAVLTLAKCCKALQGHEHRILLQVQSCTGRQFPARSVGNRWLQLPALEQHMSMQMPQLLLRALQHQACTPPFSQSSLRTYQLNHLQPGLSVVVCFQTPPKGTWLWYAASAATFTCCFCLQVCLSCASTAWSQALTCCIAPGPRKHRSCVLLALHIHKVALHIHKACIVMRLSLCDTNSWTSCNYSNFSS